MLDATAPKRKGNGTLTRLPFKLTLPSSNKDYRILPMTTDFASFSCIGRLLVLVRCGVILTTFTTLAFVHPFVPKWEFLDYPTHRSRSSSSSPQYASSGDYISGEDGFPDSVDPFSVMFGEDDSYLPTSSKQANWGIGDDWASLSTTTSTSNGVVPPSFNSLNTEFGTLQEAERIMHEQNQIFGERSPDTVQDSPAVGLEVGFMSSIAAMTPSVQEHDFVDDMVDMISNNYLDYADDVVQLYDTDITLASNSQKGASSQNSGVDPFLDHDDEIAYMIRCNQSPQQLLISQGLALPELTDEVKYKAEFLLEENQNMNMVRMNELTPSLPLQPKMTSYFENAVKIIFNSYSNHIEEEIVFDDELKDGVVCNNRYTITNSLNQHKSEMKKSESKQFMNREAIAQWMTRCLSSPFVPSEMSEQDAFSWKQSRDSGLFSIGPYDPSVIAILSRYSQHHGSGRLTWDEFKELYLECAWNGYIRELKKNRAIMGDVNGDIGVLIKGKKNTEKMLENASLGIVWRDLEAHGIFSPAEEERLALLKELESLVSSYSSREPVSDPELLMDECLLFDDYEDRLHHREYTDRNDDGRYAFDRLPAKKEKSSYELVEMTTDGETPKRIRDGQFVFIDEESCIGCAQCARISPASFKMIEETGRARTFYQRNALDIEESVMSCPVNCMHMVSFDELKEMEKSRDSGDGNFGQWKSHIPLHVAGRDSDANRKSSWYHYLKAKCSGERCPQRGCYDCPKYSPGQNPFFKERHRRAEHIRALDFIASGEADKWRHVVEL
mmetsp:Transcript_30335/g.63175  ORF Transcript_30335/g.63175 Transcript_30335/m.63175 type:complete len:782 (+) Transcript_30335:68-2413(+)